MILNESSVSNCFNKELEDKISHIDDQFNVKNLFLKNFKSNMIKLIKENKLSKEEINTLLSQAKKTNFCGAKANDALATYSLLLDIVKEKQDNRLSTKNNYSKKATNLYRTLANHGSIDAIKVLCIPDGSWVVEAVDKKSLKICFNSLYFENLKLNEIERAKMFSATYTSLILNEYKNTSKRAEICYKFANDKVIMNYPKGKEYTYKDSCSLDFILYAEELFYGERYQESFKYLSIFDQSSNGSGIPQFELGYMYSTGKGVPQNYKLAIDWYMKSCSSSNNASAQYNLGIMYMKGHGVLQNNTIAHALFNLASANGVEDAAKLRDAIANKMTREQIEKAQTLASNWLKKWPIDLSN
ncbi:tetratricopeptide repeat protein [Legionella pneumophila]|uniref:tetratricopeptide repeat protein n=1 Tax=Legionella pneumophila TaxID=446 RepID=UPI0005C43075|nr:tetratricopeptide repeat protein [Legionella pneumophila]GAN31314.1 sel1 repeat protein [Legionella pneumophila]